MSELKYRIATVSAIAAFAGVAGFSPSQAVAGEHMMGTSQASERAKNEYALQKQECDTLKNSQPQAYEPCLQKAQSTLDNLLTQSQGSEQAGQGSQGQFSGQQKGPIDKMTSAVKETASELFGSSQGQGQQPSQQGFGAGSGQQGQNTGQWQQGQPSQQGPGTGGSQPQGQSMGQGQQGGVTQGLNPLQQGFEARHGQDFAQQSSGAASGQGGQNFGQQGPTQGQQFYGQQGQSGQGSFQGGNYGQQPQGQSGQGSFQGQQPQGQSWQQGSASNQSQGQVSGQKEGPIDKMTSAVKETVSDVKETLFGSSDQGREGQQPSAGQGQGQQQPSQQQGFGAGSGQQGHLQGSSNQQGGLSTSGWIGAKPDEHMDPGAYYQGLALKQYVTLKQECDTLKQDPNVYDQCQKHAESTRDKIAGMAEQQGG